MIGLIRKDIYYLCISWKPMLLSILVMGILATHYNMGALLIMLLPLTIGCIEFGCIQNDAQKKWYDLSYVLPISTKSVVASRYLSYLFFVFIGMILVTLYAIGIISTIGIEALGNNFALWQGLVLGLIFALLFASFFFPVTYFFRGEKMEMSMIFCGFIFTAFVGLVGKLLGILDFPIRENTSLFICVLFILSIILYGASWLISNFIYKHKRTA